jgi:hypothetical protein
VFVKPLKNTVLNRTDLSSYNYLTSFSMILIIHIRSLEKQIRSSLTLLSPSSPGSCPKVAINRDRGNMLPPVDEERPSDKERKLSK